METAWNDRYRLFEHQRQLLLGALGEVAEGGVVEDVQPVRLVGPARQDQHASGPALIAISTWPFPLESSHLDALLGLGYQAIPASSGREPVCFRQASGASLLYLYEAGSEAWAALLAGLAYLQAHPPSSGAEAAAAFAGPGDGAPAGEGGPLAPALLAQARAWRLQEIAFQPIETAAAELEGFSGAWMAAGGWALDLFLGRATRLHQDFDFVVDRHEQLLLRAHLLERGWKLVTPYEGRLEPWPPHLRLELPRAQVHAHRAGKFLDFLLTDFGPDFWRYRRQPEILRHLSRAVLRSPGGIPYLAPELVLLFKSKNTSGKERGKDQVDFETVLPHLDGERRAWLRWALAATSADHPWILKL